MLSGVHHRLLQAFRRALLLLVWMLALGGCQSALEPSSSAPAPSEAEADAGAAPALQVYFTRPRLDGGARLGLEGETPLDEALIGFLEGARRRLDLAVHIISDKAIIEALKRACARGVRLRLVTEAPAEGDSLRAHERLEALPCLEMRTHPPDRALMHHKFAIADGERLWTGSANWTTSGLQDNANDAVVVHHAPIAAAYEEVFEAMLAGNFPVQEDRNEEEFVVSGTPVEVYFAPSDGLQVRLVRLLAQARSSIRVAIFFYTNNRLHKALLDAIGRGVRVEAIWDLRGAEPCDHAEVDEMLALGVGRLDALPGVLHHKFAVLDDRVVITGSANWSAGGMEANEENLIVIHDRALAQRYVRWFKLLQEDARRYDGDPLLPPRVTVRHFNTIPGTARVEWRVHRDRPADGYELCRSRAQTPGQDDHDPCEAVISDLPAGVGLYVDRDVRPGETYAYRLRARSGAAWSPFSNAYVAHVEAPSWPRLSAEAAERDLEDYLGQKVTVRFTVRGVGRSRRGSAFLNAAKEDHRTDFTAYIPACAWERFAAAGIALEDYAGRTVQVSGELISYNGPEIVVYDPGQIFVEGVEEGPWP